MALTLFVAHSHLPDGVGLAMSLQVLLRKLTCQRRRERQKKVCMEYETVIVVIGVTLLCSSVVRQHLPDERELYIEARFGGLEVTLGDEHGDILSAEMMGTFTLLKPLQHRLKNNLRDAVQEFTVFQIM